MHSKISFMAAGVALLSAISTAPWAGAANTIAGPSLAGQYIVSYTETCQALQTGGDPGKVSRQTLTLTFNPVNHTVKYTGTKTSGALVAWKGIVGGDIHTTPVSGTWKYANTTTTLTINGAAFNVLYGPVVRQIPQSLMFSGLSSPDCAASATAILLHAA